VPCRAIAVPQTLRSPLAGACKWTVRGTFDALLAIMVAVRMPIRSMTLSTQLSSVAPRMLRGLVGGMLELMIHAVETWRDRRVGAR
jgi:hypothetical protein